MWKLLAPVLLLAGAVLLAVLWDRPSPRADFVFINRGDVNTLDLHRMSWLQDLRVAGALWEGLTRPDPFSAGFDAVPGAAERWEISPDGRKYTFHLRPAGKWSNGEPLTARDFKRTWLRAILPDTGGDYLNIFGLIGGVHEFVAWREQALKDFAGSGGGAGGGSGGGAGESGEALWRRTLQKYEELVAVTTPDDRTLVIELVRPTSYFLDILAYEITYPLYMPVVEQYQRVDPATGRVILESGWTKPPVLVSNGRYMLTRWRFKRDMRMEANPHYWDSAQTPFRSISIPTVEDANAALVSARTGAADWLTDASADARADLIQAKAAYIREHQGLYDELKAQGLDPVAIDRRMPRDSRQNVHVFPSFGTFFLNINCMPTLPDGRPNPFHDARVRRAFALATDKQAVAEIRGIGEPIAGSLTPPGSLGAYRAPRGLGRDVELARRLLAEAGHGTGEGFVTVEILFDKGAGHDQVIQSLAKNWQRDLGVRVLLRQKERKVFREDLKNHNFMITTGNWFGDYGDPTTFLDINRAEDGNNDRGYASARYDGLLNGAVTEPDPARRRALLEEAERILMEEDLPLIPLVHECAVQLFDPHRVSGITPHPRQKQQLGLIDLLGDQRGPERAWEMPAGGRAAGAGTQAAGGRAGLVP